jgi:predicted TIM-barrel fold metal-dependent hydrolase
LELSPAVHGLGFTHPAVRALVAIAAAARHPVYVVCLGRAGTRAADLAVLARDFPDTTFVFGHCGYFAIDTDGLRRIAPEPNIVAETSGCLSAVVRVALDRLGPDRVLFGTEYPLQEPGVELLKFGVLGLDPDDWAKVAWHNAHRLLEGASHDLSRT